MGILEGKKILVTGVLTDASIAFHIARLAQEQGADVILTGFGRALSLTTRISGRLPKPCPVIELDVTSEADLAALESRVREHFPEGLNGVVHSIGFAPEAALGGNFLNTQWEDVATAIQVSAFSLKSLTMAARPLFNGGGSVVGLDFDAQVAWPKYDWMGVAKAALESTAPTTEPTKINRPRFNFNKPFVARRATRNAPVRFASMTDSKSSSLIRMTRPSFVIPAFATIISGKPH